VDDEGPELSHGRWTTRYRRHPRRPPRLNYVSRERGATGRTERKWARPKRHPKYCAKMYICIRATGEEFNCSRADAATINVPRSRDSGICQYTVKMRRVHEHSAALLQFSAATHDERSHNACTLRSCRCVRLINGYRLWFLVCCRKRDVRTRLIR